MTTNARRDSGRPPRQSVPESFVPVEISIPLGHAERKQLTGSGASEFSHGRGLVPRGFEDASPDKGGRYRAIPEPPQPNGTLARGSVGKPGGPSIITLAD